jgi:hypothetical protein
MTDRPLHVIAKEIRDKWHGMYYGAEPYVSAMWEMTDINEPYYNDTAKSIVLYFLANASTWRGEDAKRIKAELKKMAGVK